MCYHNSLTLNQRQLKARLGKELAPGLPEWKAVFHASGFDFPQWPILGQHHPEELVYARWGLIPHWAQSLQQAMLLRAGNLNARSETFFEKPSFSKAAKSGRCLAPSSGFFEWKTEGKQRHPYFIRPADEIIFMMAGISDVWVDRGTGEILETFALLTAPANPLMAQIHNTKKRMPCILPPDKAFSWLKGDLTDAEAVKVAADPFPENLMEAYPVDPKRFARRRDTNVPWIADPFARPDALPGLF